MIPRALLDEICARVSIAEASERCGTLLQPKGRDHTGNCLFCGGLEFWAITPRSSIQPFYHCFSCQAHGNVVGFWMRARNMGFHDAVRELAEMGDVAMEVGQ